MRYSANSVWENNDEYDVVVVGAGHAGCEAALASARLGLKTIIAISAKENTGITELENTIKEMFFHGEVSFNDEVYITNIRHKTALQDAYDSLVKVNVSIENNMPEDFYSIDLLDAYESLGSITGETIGEDLVNEIFSKFCMGK